jgi:3-deoxy-D-manno-octulosonate 8-phosphate phosphatase KdsC-like HAD superfamily phosphatase
LVLRCRGGFGAVRELCDAILHQLSRAEHHVSRS